MLKLTSVCKAVIDKSGGGDGDGDGDNSVGDSDASVGDGDNSVGGSVDGACDDVT